MARITTYVDERTRRRIARAAKAAGVSVSTWVRDRIAKVVCDEWPPGCFGPVGSLRDSPIEAPRELDLKEDAPRAHLL